MEIKVLASGSSGNCIYLSDGVTSLLLDCGIPYKKIQEKLNFQTSKLAGCLITHSHQDHCRGIMGLARSGIVCFMNEHTWDTVKSPNHRCHILKWPCDYLQLGSWKITAFPAVHDVICYGFLLESQSKEKVLYLTDSAYSKFRFHDLTHILIGCNYTEGLLRDNVTSGIVDRQLRRRVIQSHLSLETLLDMLKANDLSKLEEIYLLHLSETNADPGLFRLKVQEAIGKPTYVAHNNGGIHVPPYRHGRRWLKYVKQRDLTNSAGDGVLSKIMT